MNLYTMWWTSRKFVLTLNGMNYCTFCIRRSASGIFQGPFSDWDHFSVHCYLLFLFNLLLSIFHYHWREILATNYFFVDTIRKIHVRNFVWFIFDYSDITLFWFLVLTIFFILKLIRNGRRRLDYEQSPEVSNNKPWE